MSDIVVVYHGKCPDGIGGAWCFYHYYITQGYSDDITFIKGFHGTKPDLEKFKDKEVYIVDFSYSREILINIKTIAKKLIVLDHHISAKRELEDLEGCIFDMERSGAHMAWDYLFPDKKRIWFIDYIGDMDLWKKQLPDCVAINRYMNVNGYLESVESMNKLYIETSTNGDTYETEKIKTFADKGNIYMKVDESNIQRILKSVTVKNWLGYKIAFIEMPPVLVSTVGNRSLKLHEECDFAVLYKYHFQNKHWKISLRSRDKVDLSIIAKKYGGGGHKNAASFIFKGDIHDLFQNS